MLPGTKTDECLNQCFHCLTPVHRSKGWLEYEKEEGRRLWGLRWKLGVDEMHEPLIVVIEYKGVLNPKENVTTRQEEVPT